MTMQQTPLLLSRILGRGAILDPDVEVVTAQAGGTTHRQTLGKTWERANQVAHALKGHGIGNIGINRSHYWTSIDINLTFTDCN